MFNRTRAIRVAAAALALGAAGCADGTSPVAVDGAPRADLAADGNSGIITSGTTQLGLQRWGNLIAPNGTPSGQQGNRLVGLRFVPTNNESVSHGGQYEGWGVADATSPQLSAAAGRGGGGSGLEVVSFGAPNAQSLTSVVQTVTPELRNGKQIRVTHQYVPSAAAPDLFEATVTIQNVGTTTIGDLRYRRVLDWGPEPTVFRGGEYVTIQGFNGAANVRQVTDNFFANPNPLNSNTPLVTGNVGDVVDRGPGDQGLAVDFGFGALAVGASRTFTLFYGAVPNEAAALAALKAVGAEAYSLGQPSTEGGRDQGTPNTFIMGFRGIGGTPINQPPAPTLTITSANPATVGTTTRVTTAATDANGDAPLTCQLFWGDNAQTEPFACGATVEHQYAAQGMYTIQLRATDPAGAVANTSQQIRVLDAVTNRPPTAQISGATTATVGAGVTFTTSATDADGDAVSCSINYGDGSGDQALTSCAGTPAHTFTAAGTRTVILTARDGKGGEGTASTVVTVGSVPVNQPPVATLALSARAITAGASVTATVGATDADHDVSALTCSVAWGDNSGSASGACGGTLSHAFTAAGLYVVTVTARDPLGAVGTASDTVRVAAPEAQNTAPEIYDLMIADGRGQRYTGPISVDTKSCAGSSAATQYTACIRFGFRDADGAADAAWAARVDWGDGSSWTPNAIAAQNGSILAPHTFAQPGRYAVRVRVTDRRGASDEETITIVVAGAR